MLGKIGIAEQAVQGSTAAMDLSGRSLIGAARLAPAHPLAASALATAVGIYAYRNRARLVSASKGRRTTRTSTPLARPASAPQWKCPHSRETSCPYLCLSVVSPLPR
jgi:hypothetical protein